VQINTDIPRQRTEAQLRLGATLAGQNEKRERENIRETENMAEDVRQYQRNWNEHVQKVTPERLGRKSRGKTSIWSTKEEMEGAF
jgi:hypothetical protein